MLLAYVDKAHGNLSGPATKRILEREYGEYGQATYERLSQISSAQIYRFRNSADYRKSNATYQPTRSTVIPIGARRKPQPQGLPGFLRIDAVHQGDHDGGKGIYQINAVDEVTQWEIVGAVPQISELWLIPLLETMLAQFPFRIRGFHSDNGSEFINYTVAKLLGKLMIEQTKSRAHRSGDNGLVEAKNATVIRKHIGFGRLGTQHAEAVDAFHRAHLNPYLNFHRPCAVPLIVTEANGKRRRVYRRWAPPFELLSGSARLQKLLAAWPQSGRTRFICQTAIRHRSRARYAARQAPAPAPHRQTQRLTASKLQASERCGNAGPWTSVENRHRQAMGASRRFPTAAHRPWKTLLRFPHSHSADDFFFSHQTKKKGPSLTRPTAPVQAHPSMRKCSAPGSTHAAWAAPCADQPRGWHSMS